MKTGISLIFLILFCGTTLSAQWFKPLNTRYYTGERVKVTLQRCCYDENTPDSCLGYDTVYTTNDLNKRTAPIACFNVGSDSISWYTIERWRFLWREPHYCPDSTHKKHKRKFHIMKKWNQFYADTQIVAKRIPDYYLGLIPRPGLYRFRFAGSHPSLDTVYHIFAYSGGGRASIQNSFVDPLITEPKQAKYFDTLFDMLDFACKYRKKDSVDMAFDSAMSKLPADSLGYYPLVLNKYTGGSQCKVALVVYLDTPGILLISSDTSTNQKEARRLIRDVMLQAIDTLAAPRFSRIVQYDASQKPIVIPLIKNPEILKKYIADGVLNATACINDEGYITDNLLGEKIFDTDKRSVFRIITDTERLYRQMILVFSLNIMPMPSKE